MKRMALLMVLMATLVLALCFAQAGYADTLNIPLNVTKINVETFYGDTSLDEVDLPDGVTRIESRAFANSSLTRIYIPESVSYIASDAFDGCPDVIGWGYAGTYGASWCASHGIPYEDISNSVSDFTFTYPNAIEATVTGWNGTASVVEIPAMADEDHRVTKIAANVFKDKTISRVIFPEDIKAIDGNAFSGCTNLSYVVLPAECTTLGGSTFYGCTKLSDVYFNEELVSIGNSAFQDCTSLTAANLPDSVESMGYSVFQGCSKLASVHYPLSATSCHSWGDNFKDCPKLTTVSIQSGTTTIAPYFFSGAQYITSVTLPNTVDTIGASAFENCSALTSINLPASVTLIGNNAFKNVNGNFAVTTVSGAYAVNWCTQNGVSYVLG